MGDRITVVGKLDDINRLAEKMGNSMKRLNEPNMITLFIGIFLGIILGSIPFAFPGMPIPMKLGLAGGPLVVAILIGRFGYKMKLVTYTSTTASLAPGNRNMFIPGECRYIRRRKFRGDRRVRRACLGIMGIPYYHYTVTSGRNCSQRVL